VNRPALATTVVLAASCATGGGQRPIEGVSITGNHAYNDGDIVDHLQTQPPHGWLVRTREEFDPVALELDRGRVEAFYHERGFFDARVTDVAIQRQDDGGVKVTIHVDEGTPTQVGEIDVGGMQRDLVDRTLARAEIDLKQGQRFKHPDYLLAKDALQLALIKKGYAHAQVNGVVEVNRLTKQAIVRLDADLGPLCRFGAVTIEGLKTVPESAVRNRVSWEAGQIFDPELLDRTEGRLYELGEFSAVKADYSHENRPPVVDVTIRVAESSKQELRLGVGVGLDTFQFNVHQRSEYMIRDLLVPLTTLRLMAMPGYSWLRTSPYTSSPSIEASADLQKSDFLVGDLTGSATASFLREPRQGYTLAGPRFDLGLRFPIVLDVHLSVGWEIRYLIYSDYDPAVFGPEALSSWLGYYQERLVLDKRDRPLAAREGVYAEIEAFEGGPPAGGAVSFFRLTPDVRGYLPLAPRLVLAAHARFGKLWTTSGAADAPLPVRYYGGGANDHRGFGYQRLSPQRTDSSGNLIPIGGEEMALGSLEARYDVFKMWRRWLTVAAFVDAGDVTEPGALDLTDLHYAAGLGLRYDTIVGPVRVDVGYRLNRYGPMDPDPGSRVAFHFSLGEPF
jgi:translocation and assembly module TamA